MLAHYSAKARLIQPLMSTLVVYSMGLQLGEALNLNVGDIDKVESATDLFITHSTCHFHLEIFWS
jgi:hypothetical protein